MLKGQTVCQVAEVLYHIKALQVNCQWLVNVTKNQQNNEYSECPMYGFVSYFSGRYNRSVYYYIYIGCQTLLAVLGTGRIQTDFDRRLLCLVITPKRVIQ